jgi:hypothetical protein
MARLPEVPHLVATYTECLGMGLGTFEFLLRKKEEMIQMASKKRPRDG